MTNTILLSLVLAGVPGLAAQNEPTLTMAISPRPDRLEIGLSKVTFSAWAKRQTLSMKTGKMVQANYAVSVQCGEKECYTSKPVVAPEGSSQYVTIAFSGEFTVPSSVAAGTQVCAALESGGYNFWKGTYEYSHVTEVCRTALNPPVTATSFSAPVSGAGADAAVTRASPRGGQARADVQPAARAPARAAGTAFTLPEHLRPDLVLSYEKTPLARWIVRNAGPTQSPATTLRLLRNNAGERSLPVPKIAPGSYAVFEVTPELDQYLVNSTAMVDPGQQVAELNETNNEWKSAMSR